MSVSEQRSRVPDAGDAGARRHGGDGGARRDGPEDGGIGSSWQLPDELVAELTIRVQAAVVAVGEGLEREVQARMAVLAREMEAGQAHVARLAENLATQLRELAAWREQRDESQAQLVDQVLARLDRVAEELAHLRRRIG